MALIIIPGFVWRKIIRCNNCIISGYTHIHAGKVGGILANFTYPKEFLIENIYIQLNLIDACFKNNVKTFINLGSSCIYPKKSKQPIKEDYLLSGKLESTNEAYAIAKIVGLKSCEFYNRQFKTNYFTLMPCNMYGPNDNFEIKSSHFIPGLIKKFYTANRKNMKNVEVWGSGKAKREIMHVDDLASAIFFMLNKVEKITTFLISFMEKIVSFLIDFIDNIMQMEATYQPVMIKFLLTQPYYTATRRQIAGELHSKDLHQDHTKDYTKGSVYPVLTDHHIVNITQRAMFGEDQFTLNVVGLTPRQEEILDGKLEIAITKFVNKHRPETTLRTESQGKIVLPDNSEILFESNPKAIGRDDFSKYLQSK